MNTPRINPDDPKWTAYVLGELEGSERVEIERFLETSEEARALVEELSVATAALKDELLPSAPLMMNAEQRAAIREAVQPATRRWFGVSPAKWGVALAAAAALAIAVWAGRASSPEPTARIAGLVEEQAAKRSLEPQTQAAVDVAERDLRTEAAPSSAKTVEVERQVQRPPGVAVEPPISVEEFARVAQGGAAGNVAPATAPAGNLSGRVVDATGALIPGVTVRATETGTGTATTRTTSGEGVYSFPSLPPGKYDVAASLPGFQTTVVRELEVRAADNLRQDVTLQVGAQSTTLEVTADVSAMLAQSAASVGQVLSERQVAGVRSEAVNVVRDGISVRDQRLPAAAPPPPPPAGPPPIASASALVGGVASGQGGRGGGAGRVLEERGQFLTTAPQAAPPPPPPPTPGRPAPVDNFAFVAPNTESYDRIVDNRFIRASEENLATFSIDVDTASYANVRRFLTQNQLPPRDAVRIEEMINYFTYDYAQPSGNAPIAPNMEVAAAPWAPQNRLVRIGIKAREIDANRRPPSNLVFLIDVSGSMNTPAKLPLVKEGLKMLVNRLGENDSVSIVVYAGASGLVLPPTSGMRKEAIQQAIDRLQPGGSTNGASGIRLAYDQAVANFIRGGANRVILMTDGDFNVGITDRSSLTRLIEDRARSGVFLSVLGFGMGNIKDSTLEKLADQGNGHYAYIDNIGEARKVLVEEMGGTLVAVAKDVKIQVDFNPARVEAYRLIGYENRVLAAEDFNNDLKDAGDMGAGHTVTALFEVVPKGGSVPGPSIDPSKYTEAATAEARPTAGSSSNEMLTLRVRYKLPDSDTSTRMDVPLVDRGAAFPRASQDFRFAASVAAFGMILRDSPYRGSSTFASVLDIAEGSRGQDRSGYRQEFISLVQRARSLR